MNNNRDMKIIYAHVVDPRNLIMKARSDKSKCIVLMCECPDRCDAYSNGSCITLGFIGKYCPYGKMTVESGHTRRSKNFIKWMETKKKLYKDHLDILNESPSRIMKIGEYYHFPYQFMDMNNDLPYLSKSTFMGGRPFIRVDELTAEMLKSICIFKPRTIIDHAVIKDYQLKSVPKFIVDLKKFYPDLFESLINLMPEISDRIKSIDYRGRKAILSTLKIGAVIKSPGVRDFEYTWDGEFLSTWSPDVLRHNAPVALTNVYMKITPEPGACVVVYRNEDVTEDTIFTD